MGARSKSPRRSRRKSPRRSRRKSRTHAAYRSARNAPGRLSSERFKKFTDSPPAPPRTRRQRDKKPDHTQDVERVVRQMIAKMDEDGKTSWNVARDEAGLKELMEPLGISDVDAILASLRDADNLIQDGKISKPELNAFLLQLKGAGSTRARSPRDGRYTYVFPTANAAPSRSQDAQPPATSGTESEPEFIRHARAALENPTTVVSSGEEETPEWLRHASSQISALNEADDRSVIRQRFEQLLRKHPDHGERIAKAMAAVLSLYDKNVIEFKSLPPARKLAYAQQHSLGRK